MANKITRQELFDNLSEELKTIKKLSKLDEPQDHEDYREPLSFDTTMEIKVLLSWGGPEDGYKLRYREGELVGGVYYKADWGEYEEIELTDQEAETIADFYNVICPSVHEL